MPKQKTIEDAKKAITKLPEYAQDYVRNLERILERKDEYIHAIHAGLAGVRDDDNEYWFFTENIRSVPEGQNVSYERHWLPKYTDVGIRLPNGDEYEIVRKSGSNDTLEVRLGHEMRHGRIAVVSTSSHASMNFKRIDEE